MATARVAPNDRVKVTLLNSAREVLEGDVFALDEMTNTLILKVAPTSEVTDASGNYLHFINGSSIARVEVVGDAHQQGNGDAVAVGSAERIQKLEAASRAKLARFNKDVTPKGQYAFDHISNIFNDCRWDGTSIIVMDKYRIDPPYEKSSIAMIDAAANQGFVDRLGNMVESVAKKLAAGKPPPSDRR